MLKRKTYAIGRRSVILNFKSFSKPRLFLTDKISSRGLIIYSSLMKMFWLQISFQTRQTSHKMRTWEVTFNEGGLEFYILTLNCEET